MSLKKMTINFRGSYHVYCVMFLIMFLYFRLWFKLAFPFCQEFPLKKTVKIIHQTKMLALANSTQFLVWMKSPLRKSDRNEKGLLCSISTTQKWSSPLRIYAVNVTQSAGIWGHQVLTMATKNNTWNSDAKWSRRT